MVFPILGGNSAVGGYEIANSLRFNDNDSAYLSKTFSSGNRKTWTWSGWVKRGNLVNSYFFNSIGDGSPSTNDRASFGFSSDKLYINDFNGTSYNYEKSSTQVFRDVSAWYHIVVALDTTQATASDRIKIYVNGELITSWSTDTNPSLNADLTVNEPVLHTIGVWDNTGSNKALYYDGYLAEVNFIDGQALSPTDFGEFDEDSGIWKPIQYTGSYGTNGFYLDFENSGSLGADQSGNGNNFTPTNLASTDQMLDTPTNNFSTVNPLQKHSTTYLSEGNLKFQISQTSTAQYGNGTIGVSSGKYYWEVYCVTFTTNKTFMIGIKNIDLAPHTADWTSPYVYNYYGANGDKYQGTTDTPYGATYTTGDIIGIALDMDAGTVTFYKNNVSQGTAFTGLSGTFVPFYGTGLYPVTTTSNFGQDSSFAGVKTRQNNSDGNGYGDFYYSPPSGYLALCTQNLATALSPTIDDGSQYFNTVLWSGTGSGQSITGMGFQPDWLWFKQRNGTSDHALIDSSRGVNQGLVSNSTSAEVTSGASNDLVSFDSDGFTTGTPQNFGSLGNSGATIVTWGWKAGGTGVTNTDGSITSTVSANQTSGTSIVTYTGTGANATVGHGLNNAPEMIIIKNRTAIGNWAIYHKDIGATKFLVFDTSAQQTSSIWWQDTAPTSSVFYIGTTTDNNDSGEGHIAYCFHGVEGYSKFGSYTGNGSTDGPFVYTGFRPSFVLIKKTSSTGNWLIQDSVREQDNPVNHTLYPNLSSAELGSGGLIDFLSNGFKKTYNDSDSNASGATYIYMAFAENPFVSSTGIPVTAR